jgi:hypothetical protein
MFLSTGIDVLNHHGPKDHRSEKIFYYRSEPKIFDIERWLS